MGNTINRNYPLLGGTAESKIADDLQAMRTSFQNIDADMKKLGDAATATVPPTGSGVLQKLPTGTRFVDALDGGDETGMITVPDTGYVADPFYVPPAGGGGDDGWTPDGDINFAFSSGEQYSATSNTDINFAF